MNFCGRMLRLSLRRRSNDLSSQVKRHWVPERLYRLFTHEGLFRNLATKQPFRWILHTDPDEFTLFRINGKRG